MVRYGETGRPGHVAARKPFGRTSLIVIVMCVASFLQTTGVLAQGSSSKSFPYLYATLDDPNASYPVIDHLSPPHRGLDKDTEDRPAFLYDPDNSYRIVEYYIHWCQTCRLFAPVYTKFAQKVTEIAAAQGVSLKVYAVNCSPNRKLCLEQRAKDYPKIRLYRVNETNYHEVGHHLQLHPYSVLDTLGITFDRVEDDPWDVEREMAHGATDGATVRTWLKRTLSFLGLSSPAAVVYHRSRDDLKADIHLSFDYALRHDIFVSNDALGHDESKLFREWLELVLLAIPSSWGMADLLHELINNFVYVSRSHSYLVAVLDEYPPPKDIWSPSCSRGAPDQGYTCGLWELFHAITVGIVEFNEASFDEEATKPVEETARILRDYVAHFFGCVACREHFVAMYDSCALDRCNRLSGDKQWRELPLWLFETHNAVNVRLAKERRDRSRHAAVSARWPRIHDCRLCWKDDDGDYDPEVVYLYLKHEYGQRSPSTIELMRQLANHTAASSSIAERALLPDMFASNSHFIGCGVVLAFFVGFWTSRQLQSNNSKQKIE